MRTLLLLIISTFSFAQVSLNYFIRQDSVYIGDIVNFVIELDLANGQVPIFPDLKSENEEMSILNKIVGDKYVEYELTFWEIGRAIIPQIPIQIMENTQIHLTIETDSLELFIYSVIDQNESSIRNIKGMKEIQLLSLLEKLMIFSTFFLGILIAIYFWKKREIKNIEKNNRPKFIEPIHSRTLKALEDIEMEYPINWENAEKFYLKLTLIFRQYLAEVFYFKALEMTTNEILEFFNGKKIFIDNLSDDISQLLNRADLSKYAMHVPQKNYFISDKEKAIFLVKTIHEKINKKIDG